MQDGLIAAPCVRCLGGSNKEAVDRVQMKIPMQRIGTRTDVAESCLFLASPLSSYITGAVLVVDGGAWMTSGMCMADMQEVLASKLWTASQINDTFFLFELIVQNYDSKCVKTVHVIRFWNIVPSSVMYTDAMTAYFHYVQGSMDKSFTVWSMSWSWAGRSWKSVLSSSLELLSLVGKSTTTTKNVEQRVIMLLWCTIIWEISLCKSFWHSPMTTKIKRTKYFQYM